MSDWEKYTTANESSDNDGFKFELNNVNTLAGAPIEFGTNDPKILRIFTPPAGITKKAANDNGPSGFRYRATQGLFIWNLGLLWLASSVVSYLFLGLIGLPLLKSESTILKIAGMLPAIIGIPFAWIAYGSDFLYKKIGGI